MLICKRSQYEFLLRMRTAFSVYFAFRLTSCSTESRMNKVNTNMFGCNRISRGIYSTNFQSLCVSERISVELKKLLHESRRTFSELQHIAVSLPLELQHCKCLGQKNKQWLPMYLLFTNPAELFQYYVKYKKCLFGENR